MPGWEPLAHLIDRERIQLLEEGVEEAATHTAVEKARSLLARGAREDEVWAPFLADLPRRKDFGFIEPDDLASIQAARPAGRRTLAYRPGDGQLFDQMHGAWLGRCAGCALGKPVEGFMGPHNGPKSWERLKTYLTAISPAEWPLKDYIPATSPAVEKTGKVWCKPSQREHIAYMESDDDIRYTVLGQIVLQRYGRQFRSSHVAFMWMEYLGYKQVCTAETMAYRNIVIRYDEQLRAERDPATTAANEATIDWRWLAHYTNPYREWIGAQIRVDSYGYAAAGNPELAAEFAWRDARISHVKNGIYGAMFCSAMIAAAFATKDVREIVEIGLGEIPQTCRLYAEIRQTIAICDKHRCDPARFEDVIREIYALLDHYDAVHTNNNAAVCVMALLLSGGDFHQGITLAVMGGFDTDCNGATVGSIVGALTGAANAPQHWTARLNDRLLSLIPDYHPVAISECARRAVDVYHKVNSESSR